MPTHLVWFRRDLRLQDNLALAAACRDASARVLALYISTPAQWQAHDMAPRQAAFISAQLNALQTALAEKGIPLLFHEVADFNASIETVKNVCRQHDVSHLFYNYQYEFNERQPGDGWPVAATVPAPITGGAAAGAGRRAGKRLVE